MTDVRHRHLRRAALGLAAFVLLFAGHGWAQSGPDAPETFEALLDDTDAIVQGVVSRPAPSSADTDARHQLYDLHYPVLVFERDDGTLGLQSGPSWTQTISVRVAGEHGGPDPSTAESSAAGTLSPGAETLVFLKKQADALWVTAAFRISDKRVEPLLAEPTVVREYAGMKLDDFTVDTLTHLFLRRIQSMAASN